MKLLAILIFSISSYGFESGWVKEPIDCNNLSDNVSTECKQSLLKKGEFEYFKVESLDECRKINDSSLVWKCVERIGGGKKFALSKKDYDYAKIKSDVESENHSTPLIANATQDIAFYMKVQTILLCLGIGAGLLIAVLK